MMRSACSKFSTVEFQGCRSTAPICTGPRKPSTVDPQAHALTALALLDADLVNGFRNNLRRQPLVLEGRVMHVPHQLERPVAEMRQRLLPYELPVVASSSLDGAIASGPSWRLFSLGCQASAVRWRRAPAAAHDGPREVAEMIAGSGRTDLLVDFDRFKTLIVWHAGARGTSRSAVRCVQRNPSACKP
jgi:hypothetical protein